MTSTLTLIICAITLLALLYLLLRLPHDTTLTPPQHRPIARALGVAVVHYNGQNRALQQEEMGLLGQEPLRGYYRWWKIASERIVPTVPDELRLQNQYPLGRQDTIAAVPALAAPFVR